MNEASQGPVGAAAAREGLAGILARWWLVAIVALAGGLLGLLSGASTGSDHQVGMIASLDPLNGNSSLVGLGASTPPGPSTSQFFGDQVVDDLARRVGESPGTVRANLDAEQEPQPSGDVQIELRAKGSSTADASRLLRAWLAAIQSHRRQTIQRLLDNAERGLLRGRTRATAKGDRARAAALTNLLARLDALRTSYGTDVYVVRWDVNTATPGSQLASTSKGLFGGLIVGLLIALAISLFDGRLRTPVALEFAFGLPTLVDLRNRPGAGGVISIGDRIALLAAGRRVDSVVLVRVLGSASEERAAEELRQALKGEAEVTLGPPPGDSDWLTALRGADFWVVAVEPGEKNAKVAAQVSEAVRRGGLPPGALVYV